MSQWEDPMYVSRNQRYSKRQLPLGETRKAESIANVYRNHVSQKDSDCSEASGKPDALSRPPTHSASRAHEQSSSSAGNSLIVNTVSTTGDWQTEVLSDHALSTPPNYKALMEKSKIMQHALEESLASFEPNKPGCFVAAAHGFQLKALALSAKEAISTDPAIASMTVDDTMSESHQHRTPPMPPLSLNGGRKGQPVDYVMPPSGTDAWEKVVHKISQREKQLCLGKKTSGYSNYLAAVPKEDRDPRNPMHVHTPRATWDISKRKFDLFIRRWRRELHSWDTKGEDLDTTGDSLNTRHNTTLDSTEDTASDEGLTDESPSLISDESNIRHARRCSVGISLFAKQSPPLPTGVTSGELPMPPLLPLDEEEEVVECAAVPSVLEMLRHAPSARKLVLHDHDDHETAEDVLAQLTAWA